MVITCPKCKAENPETVKFCGECGAQLPPFENIHKEVTETLQTPVHERPLLGATR
ncbi:MAG: zinc-ribbon domain-containing protein [Promethearchaeota archaeon]